MQWRYRGKRNNQQHHEKVSFFHLAKFWMFFFCFCFWENVLFNSHIACYVTCSCRKVQTAVHRCSPRQVLLRIWQYSQEKTCVEASFWCSFRTEGLHFYLKEPPTQMFFCEYCEIFKNSFLMEDLFIIPL